MKVKIDEYEIEGSPKEMADLLFFMKGSRRNLRVTESKIKLAPKIISMAKPKLKSKTKLEVYGQCKGVMNAGDRCRKSSMSRQEDFCFMHAPNTEYVCQTKGIYFYE